MSFFSGIDRSSLEFGATKSVTLSDILFAFGEDLQNELKASVRQNYGGNTTLEESIRYKVTPQKDGFRFELFVPEYGDYLDQGVQGKGGTKKSGGSWINKGAGSKFRFTNKRPPLRTNVETPSGTKIGGIDSWSNDFGFNKWAVQEAVYRQGIKRSLWYSKVVDEKTVNTLIKNLEEAGAKQLEIDLVNLIEGAVE